MSEIPSNNAALNMSREEEEEEVRTLLERHQERIRLDLGNTDLLAVLVKNSVLTQSEEDLLLKPYNAGGQNSAPSSVGVTKRKLSAVISNASSGTTGSTGGSSTASGGGTIGGSGNGGQLSRSASVNSDHNQQVSTTTSVTGPDNRSITPSVQGTTTLNSADSISDHYSTKDELKSDTYNDADILRMQCSTLIEIIAKNGFEKFKQFCYAIENECPQLIEDLINDRLKCDGTFDEEKINEDKLQKEIDTIEYIDKDKENERNRRAVSYGGVTNASSMTTLPRAAPRRMNLMKEPPPPPPPKPILLQQQTSVQSSSTVTTASTLSIPSKYPQSEYNLIQKIDSTSTLTAPSQYQAQNYYANTASISTGGGGGGSSNYSSLLCHSSSTTSPLAVRKREKLLHRFSDAATLGRKLKKKKNINRTCRSMTEAIEMLADPVIEDEFFGDRTTWEYHTVSVTRVPGYGFGIAVSGGRDNPHFANGDPSIAVSDVLKGGPAEDRLQVNDRIISVNGVSLENVEYATAVQVLRDSGNTVTLVVKRRVPLNTVIANQQQQMQQQQQQQQQHNMNGLNSMQQTNGINSMMSAAIPSNPTAMSQPNSLNSSLVQANGPGMGQPIKVTLTKNSKKEDFGIVLGCRLFVKEISSKARDQLAANGYSLQEGDIITRIHNTNCADTMSLKEAKKIIDGCKERLNLVALRDITNQPPITVVNQLNNSSAAQANIYGTHQPQLSNCSNNLDDPYLNGGATYSSQNLYVQPPTRTANNGPMNGLNDEKSNLTPRGRSRGPIMEGVSLQQLDRPVTPTNGASGRTRIDEPPRPPPPRAGGGGGAAVNGGEDFYSSRRQLYEDDPLTRSRQSSEPRFISFQKEGSVGIRLTGGNEAGIFVTAVQPGSPASLQGLTPGDKILKVNDMDMLGVTREEAVLFLLSLQDRIDLIVQYCKEEYDEVVNNQRGDSFHIKTHFHCDNPSKGEMAFKAGDVFRVIDTLHNGVVGSWQVLKIGRGHQEMQRGVIPNKSRAEELATAQFNATKKEMNASESRGNFFRRRRSTHRRSKSLSRENWDDVVFSDSISKFPAYERVVLRHPGFVRPVVIFGPIADLAREKLAKDYPDKFCTPLQDDDKSTNSKCRIVRLSNIRDVMDRGKHALLDITPNAVDRLNYAQFYPIVIFQKTDSKHVIKQLRQGMPKSAHKSSKKLLEQCQKLERVWSHIFSTHIVLNDEESWYRKLRDAIDLQQSGAVWMSETKPVESLSDDFLFPMTSNRLSYASSPESDLELSPGPSTSLSLGNLPQLVKSNSDPSIATNQDNLDRDRDIIGEGLPPPYTSLYGINAPDLPPRIDRQSKPGPNDIMVTPSSTTNTPSRSNSSGGTLGRSAQERLFGKAIVSDDVQAEYISRNAANALNVQASNPTATADVTPLDRHHASLERQARLNAAASQSKLPGAGGPATSTATAASAINTPQQNGGSSYDSVSSYDSYNASQLTMQNLGRLGPNAPDDLKSVPNVNAGRPLPPVGMGGQTADYARTTHDHRQYGGANDLNRQSSPGRPPYHDMNAARNIDPRNGTPQRPSNLGLEGSPRKVETKTDYGKYSRNNSASQADYNKIPKNPGMPHMVIPPPNVNGNMNGSAGPQAAAGGPFKPVPPPKPKNYRPPLQNSGNGNGPNQWENQEPGSPRSPNGFYYPPAPQHHHYGQQTPGSPHANANIQPTYGTNNNYGPPNTPGYPPANGYNGNATSHHYNGGSGTGPYIAPHRGMPPPIDLAGSREQRGSAFELYRKPQIGTAGHHHNMSEMESYEQQQQQEQQQIYDDYYGMPPQHPPPRSRSVPRYPHERPPHAAQDPNYYDYGSQAGAPPPLPPAHPHHQQYYNENDMPPPLPHKTKKKSVLKSQLTAIKNAFIKGTRPLRRINSMSDPDRKPSKSALRRQNSMLERGMQRPYYPDEYPTYPAGFDERYYNGGRGRSVPPNAMRGRDQYYDQVPQNYGTVPYPPHHHQQQQDVMNSTYQNLGEEDIYGHMGTVPGRDRMSRDRVAYDPYAANYTEQDDIYANRACIDLERRQMEAAQNRNGKRIMRRHSTTTADRSHGRRPLMPANQTANYEQDDIYQSKQGAYMLDNQRRAPNSEVMTRRRFYPGAANEQAEIHEPVYQSRREMQREMQRSHLYQTKKEMQDRITQGKREMEREFSPHSSEKSDEKSEKEPIYQSRREVKESALKTRAQLREQIYQTRRETLDSMAEPSYVSKRDMGRPEPIYESKEESILQSRENETDEKKEGKTEINTQAEINHESAGRLSPAAELQKSCDTVIEAAATSAPLVRNDEDDLEDTNCGTSKDFDRSEMPTVIENKHNQGMLEQTTINNGPNDDTQDISDDVFETPQAVSSPLVVEGPPIEPLEPPKPTLPLTPRSSRAPFHISNILKRTGPPPLKKISDSRTSIETHYTSQASLPVGPPNATSTPYTSNMSLPIAGPVPTSAPAAASIPGKGSFPAQPREPTTCRGIFDSNGGTLADNVWNVSLEIPPGAIAPGVRQEIYFTVSDPRMGQAVGGPPLDMENGETMLSPLVMCGPQGLEFLVPVTLNIPHCAGRTTSLGLALKATDSEKNIHTEWDNIDLPSNAAAHTVSVKVDHF
ncbi:zonula occludens-like protein polychaetoid isoform X2 [Musca autumnalis]|uniref:zonula occludens-like protein polychaetoid isoform X2 n=1 Tax=Musca autumnalis TaxID=221902 RepID=UPI003CF5F31C